MNNSKIHVGANCSNGVAVIAPIYYPDSSASACRINVLCKICEYIGLAPTVGSGQIAILPGAPPAEFPYQSLGEIPDKNENNLIKALRHLSWGKKSKLWFEKHQENFSYALLSCGYSSYMAQFLPYCSKAKVPILVDAVEWYQPSHLHGGRLGPFALNVEIAMRYLFPKAGNIIAISRYLQRYFESKGCHVLYLPAILDVLGVTPDLNSRVGASLLKLAYTGTPGKKDLLDPMLEAILRLDPEGKRIRFTLAGPSLGYLLDLPALKKRGMRQLPACLVAPGYVTQQEAIAIVRGADFSVLLRPRQRYAMAGFPSKVPESLAVGTPIICNLTSDLGDFLVDGVNALICDAPTVDACCLALGRALSQVPPERAAMRAMARKLAETAFDYRLFAGPMREFMQRLELVNGSRHSVQERRGV